MNYPPVSVIIPTYNRPDTLARCLYGLETMVDAYKGPVSFWVGNDGNALVIPNKTKIMEWGDRPLIFDYPEWQSRNSITILEGSTGSLGANLNRLLRATSDDIILQLDDDHHLQSSLDIAPHVERLMRDDGAGWIRLWLPECTCDGTHYYHFQATMKGGYWAIKPEGELYGPSNRPHLKHRRFHEHFGYYPEGAKLGATEEGFCHAWQAKAQYEGGPDVLIPVHLGSPYQWRHGEQVGAKSWQAEGL